MTVIKGFNAHPPHIRFTQDAFTDSIGKETMLVRDNKYIGMAMITDIEVTDEGIYFTYETDADLGISLDINLRSRDVNIDLDT